MRRWRSSTTSASAIKVLPPGSRKRRHAGYRRGYPRCGEPGVLQGSQIENQVPADGRPRHCSVARPTAPAKTKRAFLRSIGTTTSDISMPRTPGRRSRAAEATKPAFSQSVRINQKKLEILRQLQSKSGKTSFEKQYEKELHDFFTGAIANLNNDAIAVNRSIGFVNKYRQEGRLTPLQHPAGLRANATKSSCHPAEPGNILKVAKLRFTRS